MINFYKINTEGYPEVGSGKTLPQGYTEFTVEVQEDGSKTYSPVELNDAMLLVKTEESQEEFRSERNELLENVDIEINIALDNGVDVSNLRAYRQALRDATIDWILPKREDFGL